MGNLNRRGLFLCAVNISSEGGFSGLIIKGGLSASECRSSFMQGVLSLNFAAKTVPHKRSLLLCTGFSVGNSRPGELQVAELPARLSFQFVLSAI